MKRTLLRLRNMEMINKPIRDKQLIIAIDLRFIVLGG